jgi:hypothetical protein
MSSTDSAVWTNTTSAWQYYPDQIVSGTVIVGTPDIVQGGANVIFESPSGVKGEISVHKDVKGIHPKLYFTYVKSKFTKLEKENLIKRVNKLRSMVISADEMDQQALYEKLAWMLAVAVRESEAFVCGFTKLIHKEYIGKFLNSVKGKTVKFEKLENFPRLIPDHIKKKIQSCKEKNIFDEYWIVYTDYTEEKMKTNKEKIREKDPIVFGKFSFQEDILYYIGDWIDEYCDITIDKVVEKIRVDDPEYKLGSIPELSEKNLKKLVEEVKVRHSRLKGTEPKNYRDNMAKEDEDRFGRKNEPNFWKRVINKIVRGN